MFSDLILGLPCLVWTLADLFKIPIQRPHETTLNLWWIQCYPTKSCAEFCPKLWWNLLVESFGLEIPATPEFPPATWKSNLWTRPAWKVHGPTCWPRKIQRKTIRQHCCAKLNMHTGGLWGAWVWGAWWKNWKFLHFWWVFWCSTSFA